MVVQFAGELQDAIAEFQRSLDRADQDYLEHMADTYAASFRNVERELEQVARQIARARAAGEPVAPNWLFKEERFLNLLGSYGRAFEAFDKQALDAMPAHVRTVAERAIPAAKKLTDVAQGAPMGDRRRTGIAKDQYSSHAWATVPKGAVQAIVAATTHNTPLTRLFGGMPNQAGFVVRDKLLAGTAQGHGPKKIAAEIRKSTQDLTVARARTIARTESHRAYRESMRRQLEEGARRGTVTGWTWWARRDQNTCAVCWAMHGTVHPIEASMDGHPNCRCIMVGKTKSWEELGFAGIEDTSPEIPDGRHEFAKLPPDRQRRLLGPTRHGLYRQGVSLGEMVYQHHDPTWGPMRRLKPLKDFGLGPGGGRGPGPRRGPAAPPPPPLAGPVPPPARKPISENVLERELNDAYEFWLKSLSADEKAAFDLWQSGGADAINAHMTGILPQRPDVRGRDFKGLFGIDESQVGVMAQAMQAAIVRQGVPHAMITHQFGRQSVHGHLAVGQTFGNLGFTSTAIDVVGRPPERIIVTYQLQRNQPAAWLPFNGPKEVLLAPGAFRVLRRTVAQNGDVLLLVEPAVVPKAQAKKIKILTSDPPISEPDFGFPTPITQRIKNAQDDLAVLEDRLNAAMRAKDFDDQKVFPLKQEVAKVRDEIKALEAERNREVASQLDEAKIVRRTSEDDTLARLKDDVEMIEQEWESAANRDDQSELSRVDHRLQKVQQQIYEIERSREIEIKLALNPKAPVNREGELSILRTEGMLLVKEFADVLIAKGSTTRLEKLEAQIKVKGEQIAAIEREMGLPPKPQSPLAPGRAGAALGPQGLALPERPLADVREARPVPRMKAPLPAGLEDAIARLELRPDVGQPPKFAARMIGLPARGKANSAHVVNEGPSHKKVVWFGPDGTAVAAAKILHSGGEARAISIAVKPGQGRKGYATSLYDFMQDSGGLNMFPGVGRGDLTIEGRGFALKWAKKRKSAALAQAADPVRRAAMADWQNPTLREALIDLAGGGDIVPHFKGVKLTDDEVLTLRSEAAKLQDIAMAARATEQAVWMGRASEGKVWTPGEIVEFDRLVDARRGDMYKGLNMADDAAIRTTQERVVFKWSNDDGVVGVSVAGTDDFILPIGSRYKVVSVDRVNDGGRRFTLVQLSSNDSPADVKARFEAPKPVRVATLPEPWRLGKWADKTQLVPIRDLERVPAGNKLGRTNIEELKASIAKEGFREPIQLTYNQRERTIILDEGNHRLQAAKELGLLDIPVTVIRVGGLAQKQPSAQGMPVPGFPATKSGYVPANLRPMDIGMRTTADHIMERDIEQLRFDYAVDKGRLNQEGGAIFDPVDGRLVMALIAPPKPGGAIQAGIELGKMDVMRALPDKVLVVARPQNLPPGERELQAVVLAGAQEIHVEGPDYSWVVRPAAGKQWATHGQLTVDVDAEMRQFFRLELPGYIAKARKDFPELPEIERRFKGNEVALKALVKQMGWRIEIARITPIPIPVPSRLDQRQIDLVKQHNKLMGQYMRPVGQRLGVADMEKIADEIKKVRVQLGFDRLRDQGLIDIKQSKIVILKMEADAKAVGKKPGQKGYDPHLHGQPTDIEPLGGGVSESHVATIGGKKYVMKPTAGLPSYELRSEVPMQTENSRDRASFLIADKTKLVKTPRVVVREVEGFGESLLEPFWEGASSHRGSSGVDPDVLHRAGVYDAIIGNLDRHAGNYLVTDDIPAGLSGKDIIAIDHGLTWPLPDDNLSDWDRSGNMEFVGKIGGQPLTLQESAALQSLLDQKDALTAELVDTGIEYDAIEDMFGRVGHMLQQGRVLTEDDMRSVPWRNP